MKVEVLTLGNIEKVLRDSNIPFKKTYSGDKYKVIEVDKKDAKELSNSILEGACCKFSNGAGGSPCDIFIRQLSCNKGNKIKYFPVILVGLSDPDFHRMVFPLPMLQNSL